LLDKPITWKAVQITGVAHRLKEGILLHRLSVSGLLDRELATELGCQDLVFLANGAPKQGFTTADNDIRHRLGLAATIELPWKLKFGTLTSVHSGLPYDITTGEDNNHDTDPNDRPPGVTRNTGRGAGFFSIDVHLARPWTIEGWGRTFNCEIAIDSFNVLNHTNPSSYVGVESSPLFGQPNAAYNGREMQFSFQVHF
jgi:hypothetical protein